MNYDIIVNYNFVYFLYIKLKDRKPILFIVSNNFLYPSVIEKLYAINGPCLASSISCEYGI